MADPGNLHPLVRMASPSSAPLDFLAPLIVAQLTARARIASRTFVILVPLLVSAYVRNRPILKSYAPPPKKVSLRAK